MKLLAPTLIAGLLLFCPTAGAHKLSDKHAAYQADKALTDIVFSPEVEQYGQDVEFTRGWAHRRNRHRVGYRVRLDTEDGRYTWHAYISVRLRGPDVIRTWRWTKPDPRRR